MQIKVCITVVLIYSTKNFSVQVLWFISIFLSAINKCMGFVTYVTTAQCHGIARQSFI